MPNGTRFLGGRDNRHVAERPYGIGQRLNPFGMHAVVIGHENVGHQNY
jgi:hypothetical protein